MPNNQYRHLKWHRRVKDYPFTHSIAIAISIQAVAMLMSYGVDPFGDSFGIISLLFAFPASLLILIGLQWRGSVIMGHGIEATGHWFGVGAWLIMFWILLELGGTFTLVPPALLMGAHTVRGLRMHVENRKIKAIMLEAVRQAGDRQ